MGIDGLLILIPVALVCCVVLPIIAIVRTGRIRDLERRIALLENASIRPRAAAPSAPPPIPVARSPVLSASIPPPPPSPAVEVPASVKSVGPPPLPPPPLPVTPPAGDAAAYEPLEVIIGRRWLAIVAIALIVGATAFFLKYAFENGWIGELGRVTLGVIAGLATIWVGHDRHRKGWRYFSEVLIGGGVTILYLSIYAAFGFYHLIEQRSAFVFLAIVVAEAHLLAMAYNARLVAVLALIGGFLVPVLISTGHDQYFVLFTYIAILDLGMLGLVAAKRWRWLGSIAYAGTQWLFWAWETEHYTPEKRLAALLFQLIILLLFVGADLLPNVRHRAAEWEELVRLAVNPFVFYGIWYSLLDDDRHVWMATVAIALAIVYTALARFQIEFTPPDKRVLFILLAIAITFVTIAVPIQLESNWVAIAWGVEGVALLWATFQARGTDLLRWFAAVAFALSIGRFLVADIPFGDRHMFTPIFNRFFLECVALVICLVVAAQLCRRIPSSEETIWKPLVLGFAAFFLLWLASSVEAYTYFSSRATEIETRRDAGTDASLIEAARQLRWAGQLAVSLLWSAYAGLLMAAGFRFRWRPARITSLSLFGITLAKVALIDTAELREFYRIIALFVLGLVLLLVAWAYQRIPRRQELS